jgi:endo-1,4-beta-D-glucanase Y
VNKIIRITQIRFVNFVQDNEKSDQRSVVSGQKDARFDVLFNYTFANDKQMYNSESKKLSDIMNCFKISESYYLIIALIVNRGTAQNYCFDPQFSDH